MLRRVRIKSVPKARTGYQVRGALANDVPAFGGADYNAYIGQPNAKVSRTIGAVPREEANLEAEGGETVVGNLDGSMMPSFKKIVGPRHTNGGVPLNLPDDSFIFSDTKSMKISDPHILKMFNKPAKKGGYTPAELSKKFDINKYREVLQNPDSDKIERKTAELMIKNYVLKLGALALAQESKKSFPQGIPEIAKPYMEANNISEEEILPKKHKEQGEMPQQEMGESPQMQGMEGQEEMPMQMPNGEPVAMPQQGMPQMEQPGMEQMQGGPMAMYGMQMGGYSMPFYADPNEMAYGGTPRPISRPRSIGRYDDGGITPYEKANTKQGNVTPMGTNNQFSSKGVPLKEYLQSWESNIPGISKMSEGEAQKAMYEWSLKNNPDAIRKMWGTHGLTAQGMKLKDQKALSLDGTGKFTEEQLKDPEFLAKLQASYVDKKFGIRQLDPTKPPPPPENPPCQCDDPAKPNYKPKDDKGNCTCNPIPPEGPCQCEDASKPNYKSKDKDGNCTCNPPEDKCECQDPETGEIYDPGKDVNGNCNECTKEIPGITPPKKDPEWWLQDTVNTMGAFGDLMSAKKYMPWEARADLEEPRPTFLDPTRELAAQSEQANIASQAAASFAGPQALNARLSQIQGAGAKGAADTLSRINNQNVNIANQFEANQVGIRNQEQMMNQQMAGRVYDKNVIANQQFDNAKRQGRANIRESYNTALTNRAKTDAMNQMYPNYQVDPSSGGMVNYTPTEKNPNPGAKEDDVFDYRNKLKAAGWSEKEITAEMARKFGKKFGGAIYGNGGGVYVMGDTIFPFMFY